MQVKRNALVRYFILFFLSVVLSEAQRIGSSRKTNTLSRAPAPPPNDCSECWCQCKRLSFRDSYGRSHGNCARSVKSIDMRVDRRV